MPLPFCLPHALNPAQAQTLSAKATSSQDRGQDTDASLPASVGRLLGEALGASPGALAAVKAAVAARSGRGDQHALLVRRWFK